jgi:hypothetical protein
MVRDSVIIRAAFKEGGYRGRYPRASIEQK